MAKLHTITLTLLFTGVVLAMPLLVFAKTAALYVSPSSGSYHKGENFEVTVLINSDVAINAVSGILSFSTQHLSVVEVSKKNSILNFWVEEPTFSNAGDFGNVRFQGVALNPGFTGSGGNVVTVIFRAHDTGPASIRFTQSGVLANDGLGSNIVTSLVGAQFTVLPQKVSLTTPTPPNTQTPQLIVVKVLPQEVSSGLSFFWETLPWWVKASVVVSIGLATILFALVALSFGVIVLIWIWSNVWHRRHKPFIALHLLSTLFKNAVLRVGRFFGTAEKELAGDIHYSVRRLAEEPRFKEASHIPSFKNLFKEYLRSVFDIAKRFTTIENANGNTQDVQDAQGLIRKDIIDIEKNTHDAV